MSNEVDIDRGALELERASIELPAEAGAPEVPQDGVPLAPAEGPPAGELTLEQLRAAIPQWKMGSDFLVNALADSIAPNWSITREERERLSDSISMALEAWFPGQYVPLKYQVLLGAGVAVFAIITARRDAHGKLPPLRLQQAKAATSSQPAPTPAAGSGVTTSG